MVAGAALSAMVMALLPLGMIWEVHFFGEYQLMLIHVDRLSWLFALAFTIMAVICSVYGYHNKKRLEGLAALVYAGSTVSMILAGDWISLIFFWELMAVSSMYLVYAGGMRDSRKASFRYIIIHMFGGNLLLGGILLLISSGDLLVGPVTDSGSLAFWLVLLGVAVNGVIPPLHTWVADAYPESSPTGGIFLSCFTTKATIYVMIRVFAGADLLIWVGVAMALYGAIYAIMENDARRLLAYHIVSQLGFMVAGVGMGSVMGIDGAAAHAICNILQKSLLFMCMGAILYATGKRKITEMGGFAKSMPYVFLCFLVAGFAISGVPLFNGFISKSITISAAAEGGLGTVELLLSLASIGTFLSIVLKMGYYIFLAEPGNGQLNSEGMVSAARPQTLPMGMKIAMGVTAILCVVTGVFPQILYGVLPLDLAYHPFTVDHLTQTGGLLLMAIVPFLLFLPNMKPKDKISLDFDWFYRIPLKRLIQAFSKACCDVQEVVGRTALALIHKTAPFFKNPMAGIVSAVDGKPHEEYDEDTYRLPIGYPMVMIILVLLFLLSGIRFFCD